MFIDKIQYISQAPEAGSHLAAIEKVLQSGGKWIQLRLKEEREEEILSIAMEAGRLCATYGAKLIINDYPGVALQSAAYGVHLGLDDMPVAAARAILGKDKCIGGTANTFEDVLRRIGEGVDYIGLGPYQFTQTKKNLSPVLGMKGYRDILNRLHQLDVDIPIIAIGGIEMADIDPLLALGVHGVAVSGLLTRANHLTEEFYANYSK